VVPMTGGANDNTGDDDDDDDGHDDDDVFRSDPLVPALERGEQDEYFSLGLVANWPLRNNPMPNSNNGTENDSNTSSHNNNNDRHQPLQEHYESFCSRVQTECFFQLHNRADDDDDDDDDDGGGESSIMFLPLESLHITVATLMSATKISDNDFEQQQQQQQKEDERICRWKELLVHASQHEDWPKTKELQLKIRGALITKTAGILLWDDLSKGISKIRQCLHSVVREEKKQKQQQKQQQQQQKIVGAAAAAATTQHDDNNDPHDLTSSSSCHIGFMDGFRTPDIIHTTFMRYRTPPPSRQSPSEANSILQRNIVCSGVDKDRNDNDNEKIPHPFFQQQQQQTNLQRNAGTVNTDATTDDADTVYIDCVKMVNCKIYLQPPKLESTAFHNNKYVVEDDETVNDTPAVAKKDENYDDGNNDYHEVYLTLPVGSGSLRE